MLLLLAESPVCTGLSANSSSDSRSSLIQYWVCLTNWWPCLHNIIDHLVTFDTHM